MHGRWLLCAFTVLALGWFATTDALAQEGGPSATPAVQSPGAAADPELDRQVRDIASSLRCPVCLGLSVADSPSELAHDMKQAIRDKLVAGQTPDEIRAYFVSGYGEWILLQPKPQGFNLVLWLLPAALLLFGAVVVSVAVWKWTRSPIGIDEASAIPGAHEDRDRSVQRDAGAASDAARDLEIRALIARLDELETRAKGEGWSQASER